MIWEAKEKKDYCSQKLWQPDARALQTSLSALASLSREPGILVFKSIIIGFYLLLGAQGDMGLAGCFSLYLIVFSSFTH